MGLDTLSRNGSCRTQAKGKWQHNQKDTLAATTISRDLEPSHAQPEIGQDSWNHRLITVKTRAWNMH